MKDKQLSEHIRDFNKLLLTIEREYNAYYKEVGDCEKSTQDLLHQIELGEFKDRSKAATRLHQVRIQRRKAKDKMAIVQPLKDWMDKNQSAINALRLVIGATKNKENTSSRYYYPRIIDDLSIGSNKPKE